MVVQAEVGDQPDMSVLVDDLGRVSSRSGGGGLVRDVVDTVVMIYLAIVVHHGCLVSLAGETKFLQMAFLLTVSADSVGVPDCGGGACLVVAVIVLAIVLEVHEGLIVGTNDSNLVQLLVGQAVPDDFSGLLGLKFGLDGGDTVEPFVVVLDGLQVAGGLDAINEGILGGFKDLIADAILQACQEELVLDKFEGVSDAFRFGFLDGLGGGSDGSHDGRLVVCEAFVGHLDAVGVVVDGLIRLFVEVSEVGASCFSRILGLISLKEFSLDDIPVIGVDSIFG